MNSDLGKQTAGSEAVTFRDVGGKIRRQRRTSVEGTERKTEIERVRSIGATSFASGTATARKWYEMPTSAEDVDAGESPGKRCENG